MTVELLPEVRARLIDVMGLRELRKDRVLSQRDLARRAGVSPKTILDIEQGRIEPQPATVRKLAEALQLEPRVLLDEIIAERERKRAAAQ